MNKLWIAILFIIFPILALADNSITFAPPLSDYSVGFLGNVFGMVDGVLHGTGSQIMGVIFSVFNAAVMALGGMIITYTMIISTMNTAHEGEMLGKKWNSIWVPVRATAGFSLLIPKASGYCLLQIGVMWIVVQGAGAADKLWSAALGYLSRGGVIIQAQQDPTKAILGKTGTANVTAGAMVILSGQVCMLAVEQILNNLMKSSVCTDAIEAMTGNVAPPAGSPTAELASLCQAGSVPSFTSTFDAVAAQQTITTEQANYVFNASNQQSYQQYQTDYDAWALKQYGFKNASANKAKSAYTKALSNYNSQENAYQSEQKKYAEYANYRSVFANECNYGNLSVGNKKWSGDYQTITQKQDEHGWWWRFNNPNCNSGDPCNYYAVPVNPPQLIPPQSVRNNCQKWQAANPASNAPPYAKKPPSHPPVKPIPPPSPPPYYNPTSPGTLPDSPPVVVSMPNFTAASGASPLLQAFNGICGYVQWNALSSASLTILKNLQAQDVGAGMMTLGDMETAVSARAVGVQQMYSDLLPAAQAILNNDPEFTTHCPGAKPGDPPIPCPPSPPGTNIPAKQWATAPFGYPLNNGGVQCTERAPTCTRWGMPIPAPVPTPTAAPLLAGTELQGAIYDYTNILKPTLTLLAQGGSDAEVQSAKAFISTADAQGWIMAGSYFFNLVALNVMNTGGTGGEVAGAGTNIQDAKSGLNLSQFTLQTLLNPAQGVKVCSPAAAATTTEPAVISVLCTLSNASQENYRRIARLFTGQPTMNTTTNPPTYGPYPTTLTPPTAQPCLNCSGVSASTVYGYLNNAVMIELPGQHGESPLNAGKHLTVSIKAPNWSLPAVSLSCTGSWGCMASDIGDVIYSKIVRPVFNTIIAILIDWINNLLFHFITIPIIAFAGIFLGAIQILEVPGINPIIALANMGTYYINFAGNMWEMIIIMEAMLTATGVGMVLIPLTTIVLPLVFSWLGIMVSIGFVTAYYIPFVPYMIFTFGSIAWLMAVVESMVAAPIVALGVIHPEGHDTFGKAEPAIMILMNIFLRPSMMIIGYISAISITYVGVWILNSGFNQAIQFTSGTGEFSQTGPAGASALAPTGNIIGGTFKFLELAMGLKTGATNVTISAPLTTVTVNTLSGGYTSWAGICAYFFIILIYTTMYMTIVEKAFTLISVLPDKVLRWIGGQPESYGEGAAQWAEQAKGKIEKSGEDVSKGMGAVGKGMSAAAAGETKEGGGKVDSKEKTPK